MCQTAFAWCTACDEHEYRADFLGGWSASLTWDYVRVARQPPNEPCDDQSKSSGWQQQTFSIA
jgi:hypothetical protein